MMEWLFVVRLTKTVLSSCRHSLLTQWFWLRVTEGKGLRAGSGQRPEGTEALRLTALKELNPVNSHWVWMQILPQLILPHWKGCFVLNQHPDESLVSEVTIHPGLPGNKGFLGCGISGCKTRKVLGKLGWLDHLASKRLWARRSTEIEMVNVAGFRVVNLEVICYAAVENEYTNTQDSSPVSVLKESLWVSGMYPGTPSLNPLPYSVLFPMRVSDAILS